MPGVEEELLELLLIELLRKLNMIYYVSQQFCF